MNRYIAALPSIRPPFLTLAPICCLLGLAFCVYTNININLLDATLTLLAGLFAAIAVNTINEYQDFNSGLDLVTKQTPFSGGSGLLKSNPELAPVVKLYAILSASFVTVIGYYFIVKLTVTLLPIGLLGLIIIASYTKILNKRPWLCFVAPGLGFAILMPLGTYIVQSGQWSNQLFAICVIPFCIVNNLLLINQLPDINADKTVGRNHISIHYGYHFAT